MKLSKNLMLSIRAKQFLDLTLDPKYSFLKNVKKHLNFLELLNKKEENIPCDFLIDEIDVDFYFFLHFFGRFWTK